MTSIGTAARSDTVESRNPADPDDLLVRESVTTPERVAAAALRARAAQREWWAAGAATRAEALKRLAEAFETRLDEAVDLVVREIGKPVIEARGEISRARSILDYYAQQSFAPLGQVMPPSTAGMLWTERRPHGAAGLVTPWNFPVAIPVWKAAPALAAGNAVLLKPAPEALASAQWLARIAADHLPDGLFQVLPGGAETGRSVVAMADVVSFTGSATVGQQVSVAAARRGVPVQAEMGGQNAAIVLPDADAGRTAAMIANAAMAFAGQKCTATRRVVVVGTETRRRDVRDHLVDAVEALRVGDPHDEATLVGPLVSAGARQAVVDAAATARRDGGRVLSGGTVFDRPGWFVTPALVEGLDPGHELAQEELFGPFAVVLAAPTVEDAVAVAEGVRYGLVTSVHGRDSGSLLEVVSRLGTGMVKVNAPTTGVDFYAPFGGERDSSYGPREQGTAALDFYTSTRTVTFARHA